MIARYSYSGLTWVDVESPNTEEIAHLMEEFELPALVGEEIASPTMRSKVDLYDNVIYLVLHFPVNNHPKNSKYDEQEIDFIISKKHIITVRYKHISPIHEFASNFEMYASGKIGRAPTHAGFIFSEIMRELYKISMHELEGLTLYIKEIENRIFNDQEELMVKEISKINRRLLDFKQAIRFHGDILRSYEDANKHFFGEKYVYYATSIEAEFNKVSSLLESNRETLSELQQTNDSLVSTKQNSIMKKFTIISFVTFPLMLVTGIFGMNTVEDLIFIQTNNDFFFVIGAMLLTSLIMFTFFKFQKWL